MEAESASGSIISLMKKGPLCATRAGYLGGYRLAAASEVDSTSLRLKEREESGAKVSRVKRFHLEAGPPSAGTSKNGQ